mmetsp:Transcript_16057/g.66134  ORF Transcript_16057/g.66134 Transcript_16057/m.66134 type:complete len:311 (-) Transcript_16057:1220-2152(-)
MGSYERVPERLLTATSDGNTKQLWCQQGLQPLQNPGISHRATAFRNPDRPYSHTSRASLVLLNLAGTPAPSRVLQQGFELLYSAEKNRKSILKYHCHAARCTRIPWMMLAVHMQFETNCTSLEFSLWVILPHVFQVVRPPGKLILAVLAHNFRFLLMYVGYVQFQMRTLRVRLIAVFTCEVLPPLVNSPYVTLQMVAAFKCRGALGANKGAFQPLPLRPLCWQVGESSLTEVLISHCQRVKDISGDPVASETKDRLHPRVYNPLRTIQICTNNRISILRYYPHVSDHLFQSELEVNPGVCQCGIIYKRRE